MEKWQREHITANLPELLRLTKCSSSLLANLLALQILGDADVDRLTTTALSDFGKTIALYEILKTRLGSYDAMAAALLSECQTGAYQILQEGNLKNRRGSGSSGRLTTGTPATGLSIITLLFAKPLPAIVNFLEEDPPGLLIVSTRWPQLSLQRILETMRNYFKVHQMGAEPIRPKLEDTACSKSLVVQCDGKVGPVLATLQKAKENISKHVVLLTVESIDDIQKVVASCHHQKRNRVLVAKEDLEWDDLHPDAQLKLTRRSVMFQNSVVKLIELPSDILKLDKIKDKLLSDLINELCPVLVADRLPPAPSNYIPRKVYHRRAISAQVFQNPTPDIYLVSGIELYQLAHLARGKSVDKSSAQMHELTGAQFIQLEAESHFERICELSKCKKGVPAAVHLVSYQEEEEKLIWVKSFGSVATIQNYVIQLEDDDTISESEFLDKCLKCVSGRPVLIADTPGMGKTFLLANLGHQIMHQNGHQTIVIFVELQKLVQTLGQGAIKEEYLCQMIANTCSEYELGRELIFSALKSSSSPFVIHLLLDGYDEVLPDQAERADQVIQCLMSRLSSNVRIYVSTRPHRKQQLEIVLGTLGTSIAPFTSEDQENFLVSFWKDNLGLADVEHEQLLRQFSTNCLRLKENMRDDFERDIAGIPLQCKLMGQVHLEHVAQFLKTQSPEEPTIPLLFTSPASSIFGMYSALMDSCFRKVDSIVLSQSWGDWFRSWMSTRETLREKLVRAHMVHALALLFPEVLPTFINKFWSQAEHQECQLYLYVPGILELGGGGGEDSAQPRFVHRTFAEYLIALFTVKLLEFKLFQTLKESSSEEDIDSILNFLFSHVFATTTTSESVLEAYSKPSDVQVGSQKFSFPVVTYFLNSLLKCEEHASLLPPQKMSSNKFIVSSHHRMLSSATLSRVYAGCVAQCLEAIGALLLIWRKSVMRTDGDDDGRLTPSSDLVLLASKHAHDQGILKQICELLLESGKCMADLSYPKTKQDFFIYFLEESERSSFVATPLHVALQSGDFRLTTFLLNEGGFGELLLQKKSDEKTQFLLNVILFKSSSNAPSTVQNKLQIIKLLVAAAPHIVKECPRGDDTPILQSGVHLELLKLLVQLGSDVNATTGRDECLLHTCVNWGDSTSTSTSPEGYQSLLELLANNTKANFRHFNLSNDRGETPLLRLIRLVDIDIRTVVTLVEHGASINSKDHNHNSVLFGAICKGRDGTFIHELVQLGADLNSTNLKGESAPHIAAHLANIEALEYLIQKKADGPQNYLDVVDAEGKTPLHSAVDQLFAYERLHGSRVDAIHSLISAGANPCLVDPAGRSVLHLAADRNVGVSATNHLDPQEYHQLVQYFDDQHKATTTTTKLFQLRSAREQATPLHYAVRRKELILEEPTLHLLLKHNGINDVDAAGDSVLFYGIRGGRSGEFLGMLVRHGADLRWRNHSGFNALHVAAQAHNVSGLKLLLGMELFEVNGATGSSRSGGSTSTPLHLAVSNSRSSYADIHETVKLLMEAGADVHAKDGGGRSPLELAMEAERKEGMYYKAARTMKQFDFNDK